MKFIMWLLFAGVVLTGIGYLIIEPLDIEKIFGGDKNTETTTEPFSSFDEDKEQQPQIIIAPFDSSEKPDSWVPRIKPLVKDIEISPIILPIITENRHKKQKQENRQQKEIRENTEKRYIDSMQFVWHKNNKERFIIDKIETQIHKENAEMFYIDRVVQYNDSINRVANIINSDNLSWRDRRKVRKYRKMEQKTKEIYGDSIINQREVKKQLGKLNSTIERMEKEIANDEEDIVNLQDSSRKWHINRRQKLIDGLVIKKILLQKTIELQEYLI